MTDESIVMIAPTRLLAVSIFKISCFYFLGPYWHPALSVILQICDSVVSAQYLENELTEYDQI